ncbi:MAG: SPOR domain-containing protein [Burkholderiales bacterium]|nr:SPOR domain-containing protein [Burkholderiales bacterium]
MARPISDEELQLRKRARRRLIGAIVLVAAVAAVLPMVLDTEPKPVINPEVNIKIPSPDSGAFTAKVTPIGPAPDAPAKKVEPESAAPAAATEKPAPQPPGKPAPAKKAPVKAAEKTQTTKDAPPKAPAAKAAGQFVVQVAALSDPAKAKQMQQRIAGAGIKSYTEIVKTEKGEVTRVRAGPFATRAAAEQARDQLKAMGLNGNVTTK